MRSHRQNPSSFMWFFVLLGVALGGLFLYLNSTPDVTMASDSESPVMQTLGSSESLEQAVVRDPESRLATAQLSLPNAGVVAPIIDVFIREGSWDVANLGAFVGHLHGTSTIGSGGNIGLAGHSELRDGSRGIFAYIQELNYGDPIHIELDGQRFEYRVTGMANVSPTDLSVLQPTSQEQLTLITCDDYDFLRNLYQSRVVVFAQRVA